MKILLCHNRYRQTGGEDRAFEDDLWLLKANGHAVETFVADNRDIDSIGKTGLAMRSLWNPAARRSLEKTIRRFRPDIVHFNNTFPLFSHSVHYAARDNRVPIVQTLHNFRTFCANALLFREGNVCERCLGKRAAWSGISRKCYRKSSVASVVVASTQLVQSAMRAAGDPVTTYIAPSRFAREKLISGGIPADRLEVRGSFVRAATHREPSLEPFAVFVGRLSEEKGVNLLLEAWRSQPANIPLRIIGDGPMSEVIEKACEQDERLTWHQWLSPDEVMTAIAGARFLVMPSIWYETFGRTVIEAFACGVPVIASRLGAVSELVEHEHTGLQFEPGNMVDLNRCVERLTKDDSLQRAMAQHAQDRYQERYTPEANYRELLQLYEKTIERHATGTAG